jgi:hypothetical protein
MGDQARADAAAKRALALVGSATSPEAQRVRADAAAATARVPRAPRPTTGGAYGPAQTWDPAP